MKFYKFWALAEAAFQDSSSTRPLRAYGGSNESLEDARQRAQEIAQRVVKEIERGQRLDTYGYERPLREEIVEEIRNGSELAAVITRNSYGALVLNTSRVMFVDVDYRQTGGVELAAAVKTFWNRLTGRAPKATGRDDQHLERFEQVTRSRPNFGIRVYRTSGGFRLLVTSQAFDPASAETEQLLKAFGSDKLYIRLCKAQDCFRARLSAKYWRCGATKPPLRFPWADAAEEARYRKWEQEYHRSANQYATCALVGSFGEAVVHAEVAPILETHDRLTIKDGAQLA